MQLSPLRFGAFAKTSVFKNQPNTPETRDKAALFAYGLLYGSQLVEAKEAKMLAEVANFNRLSRPLNLTFLDQCKKLMQHLAGMKAPDKPSEVLVLNVDDNDVFVTTNRDKHLMDMLLYAFVHFLMPAVKENYFTREEVDNGLNELLSTSLGTPTQMFGNCQPLEEMAQAGTIPF